MEIEYSSLDNKRWRVADGGALMARFGLKQPSELPLLHACLAEKSNFFQAVSRTYGIRSFVEMDPAKHVAWEDRLIAEEMHIALPAVEDLRKRAVTYWERAPKAFGWAPAQNLTPDSHSARAGQSCPDPLRQESEAIPSNRGNRAGAAVCDGGGNGAAAVEASLEVLESPSSVLERIGFKDEKDQEVRAYLLGRAEDLADLLSSSGDRPTVLQMLQDEVTLFFVINRRMTAIRQRMAEAHAEGRDPMSTDEDRVEKFLTQQSKLQKNLEAAKAALGIGEEETGGLGLKVAIKRNASTLLEGVRAWYANADHELLDGVFTAGEVQVTTRAYGDRPAQYRLDLPFIVQQFRDNLWRPDWEPVQLTRDMMRRLRGAWKPALDAMMDEEGLPAEDLQDDDEAPGRPAAVPVTPAADVSAVPALALPVAAGDDNVGVMG